MFKPILILVAGLSLAACSTIDFGPEPGTEGDEFYWHFNPDLHEPGGTRKASAVKQPAAASQETQTAADQPAATTTSSAADSAGSGSSEPVLPPQPPQAVNSPAPESEALFEDAIRKAVAAGDVDRALRLLEDAERLGSRSARPAFIEAVQARGRD
jgi:maltose operon protein